MISASVVCHDLNIHTLILRNVNAEPFYKGMYLNDRIWATHHGRFHWTFSAQNCIDLKKYLTDLLGNLHIDVFQGLNDWQSECAFCTGEICNIRFDIGEIEYMEG